MHDKAIFASNYCQRGETPQAALHRVAGTLASNDEHFTKLHSLLNSGKFWPSGRILANVGTLKSATPVSCFASGPIPDSIQGIMQRATEAAETMRMTGSVGYDLSTLRPEGWGSGAGKAAGPCEFARIFDAVGQVIQSGGRRGVQLATLRIDHPDIESFIHATYGTVRKAVAVTDEFMQALTDNRKAPLKWQGRAVSDVRARDLWEILMRQIYVTTEPYLLFTDRINRLNPLHYAETITTANPWLEQPLPAYGSCPLGSFNLSVGDLLTREDVEVALEAMDNLIDLATYPLPEQARMARATRRVGLGVMGLWGDADTRLQCLGELRTLLRAASKRLAISRGAFPMQASGETPRRHSHLMSIAPTETIAAAAGVSAGLTFGLPAHEQIDLLGDASSIVDGGIASQITVSSKLPWQDFQGLSLRAWTRGAKALRVRVV